MATRSIATSHDWTVDRLHALPDDGNRYEIIDGVLHVTPAPRLVHQRALRQVYDLLMPYAKAAGLEILWSPADIRYSERTVVQPDLFGCARVPSRPVRDWQDLQLLSLVVEVLSRSTRTRDRTVKRALYQAQGIPEYWIIDTDALAIERWRPGSTAAECLAHSISWQPMATVAPLDLDVVAYFAAVLDR